MHTRTRQCLQGAIGLAGIVLIGLTLGARQADDNAKTTKAAPAERRISVDAARDRAKLIHKIYAATLDTMHHHYFQRERAVLPARAMEDVFDEIADQTRIETRWIAVNTRAMSIDHAPKTPFEQQAVEKISAGKGEHELVEDGFYRRAGAIPLAAGCVGCHAGSSAPPPKSPRFAGLVISVPLNVD